MKILLRQIEELPASVIFWRAPRLRFDGWIWAPYSMMHRFITHELWAGGKRGIVRADGFEVQVPVFRFGAILDNQSKASKPDVLEGTPVLFVL